MLYLASPTAKIWWALPFLKGGTIVFYALFAYGYYFVKYGLI